MPNINFSEYIDFAKGEIQLSIFQKNTANQYFSKITETATDQTLIRLAEIKLIEFAISKNDDVWMDSYFTKMKSNDLTTEGRDEALFLCGEYYFRKRMLDKAGFCFEQIIGKNVSSPFAPLSRNYLNAIRKSQS